MNLEIFKISDPTGKISREKYLLKNHIEEYDFIIKYSIDNNLINLSFKEKIYLCINSLKTIPVCKNPNCLT